MDSEGYLKDCCFFLNQCSELSGFLNGLLENSDLTPLHSQDFKKLIPESLLPPGRVFLLSILNKSNRVVSYFCLGKLRHLCLARAVSDGLQSVTRRKWKSTPGNYRQQNSRGRWVALWSFC
jgi:hypothetical protein